MQPRRRARVGLGRLAVTMLVALSARCATGALLDSRGPLQGLAAELGNLALRIVRKPASSSPTASRGQSPATRSATASSPLSALASTASSPTGTAAPTARSAATSPPASSAPAPSTRAASPAPPSPAASASSAVAAGAGCEVVGLAAPDARSMHIRVTLGGSVGHDTGGTCASALLMFTSSADSSAAFTSALELDDAGAAAAANAAQTACAAVVYFPFDAPAGRYTVGVSGAWAAAGPTACRVAAGDALLALGPPPPPPSTALALRRLSPGPLDGSGVGVVLSPASGARLAIPAGAAHSPARFVLDAAAFGRPAPASEGAAVTDLWRVDVTGALPTGDSVRAGVQVDAVPAPHNASVAAYYGFQLALPPVPGVVYTLELFLQQAGFNVGTFRSDSCAETRDAKSLVLNVSLRVVPGTVATRVAAPAAPAAATPQASVFIGWYTRNATADRSTYHSGGAGSSAFRYFSPPEARACLADKWLAFIGDSTMEELALSTLLLTGASYDEAWSDAYCPNIGIKTARVFDSARAPPSPLLAERGTRITMHWAAAPAVCSDLQGTFTFTASDFLARLRAAHAPDRGGARKPSHVVFNTGLHDLARSSPPLSAGTLREHLGGVIATTLRELGSDAPIIWKSSNPKTGEYACRGHGAQTNVGEAAVQAVNRLALGALADAGLAVRVLDEHALLLPFHEPAELRQHHCSDVLMRPPRSLDRVFSGCLATAHALLGMVCPA